MKANSNWLFCRLLRMSKDLLLATLSVRAFVQSLPVLRVLTVSPLSGECLNRADRLHWLTMPDADFCAAIGKPYGLFSLSAEADQQQRRSPEVSSTVFHAQPPNLRSASLMDMDFVVPRPLVRRSRLIFGFCSSARAFAKSKQPRLVHSLRYSKVALMRNTS